VTETATGENAPAAIAGKRMVVIEEALKTHSGHWFEYLRAVSELNARAGARTTVVVHRDAEREVVEALDAHALFPWTFWDGTYNHPRLWRRLLGLVRHNLRVFRIMNRFVKRHGPFDMLFAPSVVNAQVVGWRLLMWRQGGRRIDHMVLFFRNNVGAYGPGQAEPIFPKQTKIMRWTLRSFLPLIREGRVRIVTDSEKLADEYEQLSGIRPEVFPSPRIAPPPLVEEEKRAPGAPLTLSCLGPARFEKGIDILQDAIRAFLTRNPDTDVRFVVQWDEPILNADGTLYEPMPELVADARVDFIDRPMNSAAYDAALAATDCMLLPYQRASYYARISGVAVEAVTAGIPVVYTRDSWCEDLVRDNGAGIGIEDGDVEGLTRAIAQFVDAHEDYRAKARERAEVARREHSPEAFTTRLWDRMDETR
jgi:glycosyltransferase involved in cell wall biosynthesis